ncbi:Histone acetyltransferase mst2 [Astathelohania contejeani]|uniref:Histone acetyltransferase n=1 Tax=Astathelohania contejeani TaxID=164912 RepID=A0ABQ7HXC6_9MICR|nr:Histone acetyltransferase mst2 [Thelohania contejeani]
MICGHCLQKIKSLPVRCEECSDVFHKSCILNQLTLRCHRCFHCYLCNIGNGDLNICLSCDRAYHKECNDDPQCDSCRESAYKDMTLDEIYRAEYSLTSSIEEGTPDSEFYKLFKDIAASLRAHHKKMPLSKLVLGKKEMSPRYYTPYSIETSTLYLCPMCLEPWDCNRALARHKIKCIKKLAPGIKIYHDGNLSVYEIDGSRDIRYCRNLCLLGKAFLDSKTLYYDVEPFCFYVLFRKNELVGYFSKEKTSPNYNLSCIVVLPCYQGQGLGFFLIDFSYKLSLMDGKVGTPEKPLSNDGLKAYINYWQSVVYDYLNTCTEVSIEDISNDCGMTVDDVIYSLELLGFLVKENGKYELKFVEKTCTNRRRCSINCFI